MHEHASVVFCLLAKPNAECTFRFPLVGLGLMGTECFSLEVRFSVLLNLGSRSNGNLRDLSWRYGPPFIHQSCQLCHKGLAYVHTTGHVCK